MPLPMQAKILRVIQEKQFERIGGSRIIKVDVRIISATNRDLEAMVNDSTFREDLYYRLNVVSIILPPLRERKEDIPLLVYHFVESLSEGKIESISKDVLEIFMEYDWKGNIRQLRNAIEHAIAVSRGKTVQVEDLPKYLQDSNSKIHNKRTEKGKLYNLVENIEKQAIIDALEKYGYNKTAAIKSLGISRRTFYKKLKIYGIN